MEAIREAKLYGKLIKHYFSEAIERYQTEKEKKTLKKDIYYLKAVIAHIGDMPLEHINMDSLNSYIKARKQEGVKNRTINSALQAVRQVLTIANREWFDNHHSWLQVCPKIKLLSERQDAREPYPLSWDEQERLIKLLPAHLVPMVLFKVNTGTRDQEVCKLQWQWEIAVPELNTSVFVIPGDFVKNGDDRLVVLNRIAKNVIDAQRGKNEKYVFVLRDKPIYRINNKSWRTARERATLSGLRVHDLKHTYGMRLRQAGVDFETRQELLGHRATKITTHYSMASIEKLIEASEKACDSRSFPTLISVKRGK